MPKNDHDITNKNKPIQAESRLEPESSLDSLKVRTDDKLGVPLHSESRKHTLIAEMCLCWGVKLRRQACVFHRE